MARQFIKAETFGITNTVRYYYDPTVKAKERYTAEITVYDASQPNGVSIVSGAGNHEAAALYSLKFLLALTTTTQKSEAAA